MIRKNEINPCPFGLSIPEGCNKAGDTVTKMEEGQKNKLINTGSKCVFNAQENDELKFVNCNFGEATQGMGNFNPQHASPLYPRLWEGFNTINLDRQYHNYKDFSYFSLYGSNNPPLSKRAAAYARCKVCGMLTETETLCTHEKMCDSCFEGPEKGHDWLGLYEGSQGKIGRRLSYRDIESGPIVLLASFASLLRYGGKEDEEDEEDKEKVPNPFRRNFDYGTRQGALMI